MNDFKHQLITRAQEEGFVMTRVCRPDTVGAFPTHLKSFLASGYHGEMDWMERRIEWRSDPRKMWSDVRSIVMLAENYTPSFDPLNRLGWRDRGVISVYAQNQDYHQIIKKKLKRLAHWIISQAGGEVKIFVDTAPIPEKVLGQAAGLGWQGKHTNLVSRFLGNWIFLGSIFLTLHLETDEPEIDHCGSCQACLNICPTNAFPEPYQLDARRCISYLTIEHKGPVPEELRPLIGNRIYGCDDCLAVCPWNKFAEQAHESGYLARPELKAPQLAYLAKLTDSDFRRLFSSSPIKRIGRNRFIRNVLYAIGNSGRPKLSDVAKELASDVNYVVADAAKWAVKRLSFEHQN